MARGVLKRGGAPGSEHWLESAALIHMHGEEPREGATRPASDAARHVRRGIFEAAVMSRTGDPPISSHEAGSASGRACPCSPADAPAPPSARSRPPCRGAPRLANPTRSRAVAPSKPHRAPARRFPPLTNAQRVVCNPPGAKGEWAGPLPTSHEPHPSPDRARHPAGHAPSRQHHGPPRRSSLQHRAAIGQPGCDEQRDDWTQVHRQLVSFRPDQYL